MLIIGVDPGLNSCGWGVIDFSSNNSFAYIASGVIKTNAQNEIADRLKKIFTELGGVLERFSPDAAALEEVFVNMNSASSMKLVQARTASLLSIALKNIEVKEYSTRFIKKAITGFGAADKEQIIKMLQLMMPDLPTLKHDEADAIAAAVCCGLNI